MKCCPRCGREYRSEVKMVCNRCSVDLEDCAPEASTAETPADAPSRRWLGVCLVWLLKVAAVVFAGLVLYWTIEKARYDYQHEVTFVEWTAAITCCVLAVAAFGRRLWW